MFRQNEEGFTPGMVEDDNTMERLLLIFTSIEMVHLILNVVDGAFRNDFFLETINL